VLYDGISFSIQIIVFLAIGSFADIGNWRPNILIAFVRGVWLLVFVAVVYIGEEASWSRSRLEEHCYGGLVTALSYYEPELEAETESALSYWWGVSLRSMIRN
jgi:hypothetical protein